MSEKTRKEKIWSALERNSRPTYSSTIFIGWIVGFVLFLVKFLLKPFAEIRIGLLKHRAMGRFYGGTEYFLRMRAMFPPKRREFAVLISGTPVNLQILKMIARKIAVVKSDLFWKVLDNFKRYTPDDSIWIDLEYTGWLRGGEWTVPGPQLSFTADEHKKGRSLLRKLGIPEGSQHVCIFAKDRLYTDSPDTVLDPKSYWGTRDFRNCNIKNYLPAAHYLAEEGIYVFRMGIHHPEELLPDDIHPNIIDYNGKVRSTLDDPDFSDAYLQATCKFFLGCTSGIYQLSSIFGVPVAYANMVPYGECGRMDHDIFIVKKCRNRANGEFIPIQEMINMGVDSDWLTLEEIEKLENQGIEFVENTDEEILDLAKEMNMRLDGRWKPTPEDEKLQKRYREISPAICFDGSPFPGMVGAEFLRSNKRLLN